MISSHGIYSQELSVKALEESPMDISASKYERRDANGNPCALVKVRLPLNNATFEGNVVLPVENKTGEYWVYMTEGAKELRIKHEGVAPLGVIFSDHGFIKGLRSLMTYNLSVSVPQSLKPIHKQDLIINYSPKDAMVLVDSKPCGEDGKVTLKLAVGEHNYIIAAKGYASIEGKVVLTNDAPRILNETLVKIEDTNKWEKVEKQLSDTKIGTVVEKFCALYDIELTKEKMSDIEVRYGVKSHKEGEHMRITLKDGTEFIDTNDNGIVSQICIHPDKISKELQSFDNLTWKSSFKEWNEWFTTLGFERKKYEPYYAKQAMLVYADSGYSVILMFSGSETKKGTLFSVILTKENK